MAFPVPIRPVLAASLAAVLSACGAAEADPHRFETMAETVAAIPVEGPPAERSAGALRPAVAVEVMAPHDLWDARDAEGVGSVEQRVAEAAEPIVTRAVLQQATTQTLQAVQDLRPARTSTPSPQAADPRPAKPVEPAAPSGLVQLGAYASEAAAEAAWTRLKNGDAAWAVEGLAPVYEPTEVNGRRIVRLKTRAPGAGAAALCAAAGIDDPWCHRGG